MQIEQLQVDLLDMYSTLELLRNKAKNNTAAFSFLTNKGFYDCKYGRVESERKFTIEDPPFTFPIESVRGGLKDKNFWRGKHHASNDYQGYGNGQVLGQAAWDNFVPFRTRIPLTVQPPPGKAGWTIEESAVYLWSCGFAVSLRLNMKASITLEDFVKVMKLLETYPYPFTLGHEQRSEPILTLLSTASRWVQHHIVERVLKDPLPPPANFGPFVLIAVRRGSMSKPFKDMDDQTRRLIYAATSQDSMWKSYPLKDIINNFKDIDRSDGSFIFMQPMARFFWFPALMNDSSSPNTLGCYIENTKAATMMMVMLKQFRDLVYQGQNRSKPISSSGQLRDLFPKAETALGKFKTFYPNTNLKRLAEDLGVQQRPDTHPQSG